MASTYRQVGYGSTGSAVSKLQTVLNEHGYSLAVDGIFGAKTQAAVRDYQKRNNLKLDGIAGKETWGSLLAAPSYTGGGSTVKCTAIGNGRLDAVATALETQTGMHFTLVHYSEHALDSDTDSRACSYVGLKWASGEETWGCGTHTDIIVAGIRALVSAINNR